MAKIILHQIPFNIVLLFTDSAHIELEEAKKKALSSPPVVWAVKNGCKVEVTNTFDNVTGEGTTVYYAELNEMQQTEFALRF